MFLLMLNGKGISQNHGITVLLGLKGISDDHLVQPPYQGMAT